jgi:eukaryotic translation initiation factor 2C
MIPPEVSSRYMNRAIIAELVRLYRESDLGMRLPAYDGRSSLYTTDTVLFDAREFIVRLAEMTTSAPASPPPRYASPPPAIRRPANKAHVSPLASLTFVPTAREYRVAIKFAARANLHHLREFIAGRQATAP